MIAKRLPACKLVHFACKRHLSDLKKQRTRAFPYRFDEGLADKTILFFSLLPLTKGRQFFKKPFILEPWQCFLVGSLFGWVEKKTGLRRYRYSYVEVPRKNGKSELAAGVGLKLAFFDDEPGAEVYSAATKRDQSKLVWDVAKTMVKHTPDLRRRIRSFQLNLSSEATNSKFEPLGADHSTLDGLNVHGVIIDELHAHRDRRLVDVLETATGSRLQPLQFEITTAGEYDPESICWKHREYSRRILEGLHGDDRWFCYIATIDEGDKFDDPKVWAKANPNLGVSKGTQVLESESAKALEMPSEENKFRRYHLDEWTKQAERWIAMNVWDECVGKVDAIELTGKRCFAGLDLASTKDINALVLLFPDEGYKALPFFWVPEEGAALRVKRDRMRYDEWIRLGFIEATPGNVTDYAYIRRRILELGSMYDIRELAIDEWNATYLATQLEDDNVQVVLQKQNMAQMAAPTKELERLIMQRVLQHGANPVLSWMFDNVSIKMDSEENIKINREKSREKVDGIVALVMALGLAIRTGQGAGKSVYDDRGILAI